MEIIFKVGKKIIFVQACDFCFDHKAPKDGVEIARRSTISSNGNIPVYYLCKECGKDKFNDKKKL